MWPASRTAPWMSRAGPGCGWIARRWPRCAPNAVVLSPMPVIDEIASTVRGDPRIRMLEQSDDALFVRMALIEALLSPHLL